MDTLNTVIKTSQELGVNSLDVLEKVDYFYNSAWNKLVLIGSISFAIVGIVVPLLIQWYQKKVLVLSENKLKAEIKSETSKIEKRIKESVQTELEEKIKDYEKKIESLNASSNAKAFHLQANSSFERGEYQSALADYITASFDYLKADDFSNLQTTLRIICDNCLQHLSSEEINDIKIFHGEDLDKLLEELDEKDNNGTLTQQIRWIKLKLSKLPPKKEEKK